MVTVSGCGDGEMESYLMGIKFQICKIKKFWGSISQQCEHIKHYGTVHFILKKDERGL